MTKKLEPVSMKEYEARVDEIKALIANGELDDDDIEAARAELAAICPREGGRLLTTANPLGKKKGVQNRVVVLQARMEEAIRANVAVEDLQDVVQSLVDLAKAGDIKAAKVVMDSFVAKPRHVQDDVSSGTKQINIQINNASGEPGEVKTIKGI